MKYTLLIIAITTLLLTANANASLIDRGNGLIYDTDLDITWLQDANYAMTSGYNPDGMMSWSEAYAWVGQLQYAGFDGWRLPYTPTIDSTCSYSTGVFTYGNDCIGSEQGHLYHVELSNDGYPGGLENTGPFNNYIGHNYWGSAYELGDSWAWSINGGGETNRFSKDFTALVLAVHDGDIGVVISPVPSPASVWLFISGLIGLFGFTVKKE